MVHQTLDFLSRQKLISPLKHMAFNWKNEYYRYHRYFFDVRQTVTSPRFRSFGWLSLTVFVVSFFIIVAIKPTLVTIAKLQREISDKEAATEKLQIKIDSLVRAQAEMVNYLDDIEVLDKTIPDEIDYAKTALIIEDIAQQTNLQIKSLSFSNLGESRQIKNTNGGGKFLSEPFNVSLSGNYTDMRAFLARFENSKRLPLFDRTSFSSQISETGNQLNLTITGEFLYQGRLAGSSS